MYVVSDPKGANFKISAKFSGPGAYAAAKTWAGYQGKITHIYSKEIWDTLKVGDLLPKRYL